ncbi:MAG TPA: hypothetical protein DEO38_00205 [Bacteroidales bacterium]|nr:hypothetical protein [Bacteroidales bacterium]
MKNPLKALLAFVGGAVAGALAGVLFAPKSGKETREDIAKKFDEVKAQVVAILDEKGIKLSKEEFEKFVKSVMEKLKANFSKEDIADAVEEVVEDAEIEAPKAE